MVQSWAGNQSLIDRLQDELPQSTYYWFLISIVSAIAWVVYLTYYNSRMFGLIITIIVNRFVKYGHIKFGSLSFSVLSGKLLFRDVHIVTEDFAVRIQLGWAIFRWWRPLTQREYTEDLSHSETRLSVYLDTFEVHVYNRSANYARLEKLFGFENLLSPETDVEGKGQGGASSTAATLSEQRSNRKGWQWRDLIPVIKMDISSGRFVFGNHLVPTSMSLSFREAHLVYTTKPASTPFDQFMHIIKCKIENLRIMLVPSLKYNAPIIDEPPRLMGEGFVVLQSNDVQVYYYMDEPGLVPYEPELVELANGDVIARRTWPCWGMDIKCGKGTDISYGPWADRQREYLWKLFYPADYQTMEPTVLPVPGQVRVYRSFDFKTNLLTDSTIDILFTKNKETQAVHMNCGAGSYLEFTIPWIIEETGYRTHVIGQMLHLDATTSLQYRSLVECETLEFDLDVAYPAHWNDHQEWRLDLTACKATLCLIFHHKSFFMDMIEDWSSKAKPDIYHFVPYTWRFNLIMKEFELLTLANEYNWIDCSSQHQENAHVAFGGEMFDLTLSMPFIDYLPLTVPVKFFIRGESVECRVFLPETNTSRHVVLALSQNMKIVGRDGTVLEEPFLGGSDKKWRKATQKSAGWVDCWATPIVALSISYLYHPIPPTGEDHKTAENLTTPEAEEQLLIPLRLVPLRPLRPKKCRVTTAAEEFDPTTMDSDVITVELEIGPSVLCVYGSLLRNFLQVKENYLGEDQKFTDLYEVSSAAEKASNFTSVSATEAKEKPFDPRHYRPLDVRVQVTIHDIQAHLVKNCNEDDPPCPCIYIERIGFEMDKRYEETKLQALVSPAFLIAKDNVQRPKGQDHLSTGHLALSGLQVRGHAMFSHEGLPLGAETLEYGWLLEVTVGDLTGKITAPQLKNIAESLQTFVYLVDDAENELQRVLPYKICHHGIPQPECRVDPNYPFPCPTSDYIKYRMTRCSVDCIDLYLVEAGVAMNIQVYPIRVATCNLHGRNNKAGVTTLIPHINLKQFILSAPVTQSPISQSDTWVEAGGVSLGPINIDAAMALPSPEFHIIQDVFLKLHDKRTHRLKFLWPPDLSTMSPGTVGKCGCVGGCVYFGNNRNGPVFFSPSDRDFVASYNAAVYHVCTEDNELGFGQSILQKGQLVFDIQSASLPVSPRKAGRNVQRSSRPDSKVSTDTLRTSATLVDESQKRVSLLEYLSDSSLERKRLSKLDSVVSSDTTLKDSVTLQLSLSDDREETMSRKSGDNSIPSELIPGSPMPDPYDTDHYVSSPSDSVSNAWLSGGSGSVTSLPEVVARRHFGHERKYSYDPAHSFINKQTKPASSYRPRDKTDSPISPTSRSSKSSLPNSDMRTISRHSSLTSPVLRRLSSQVSMQKTESSTSVAGSDNFFSATESIGDSRSNILYSDVDGERTLHTLQEQSSVMSDDTLTRDRTLTANFDDLSANDSRSQTMTRNSFVQRTDSVASEDSDSIMSFVSAVSSQQDSESKEKRKDTPRTSGDQDSTPVPSGSAPVDLGGMEEPDTCDMGEDPLADSATNYVDLHGQINQQITKSPLLMSCYLNHMTQLQCSHWSAPLPLPYLATKPGSLHQELLNASFPSRLSSLASEQASTPAWIPQFAYTREGFGPGMMVNKREPRSPPSLSSPSSESDTNKKSKKFFDSNMDDTFEDTVDNSPSYEDHVSKTTAVVNLKGPVEVTVTPLLLESVQRYVEAVTPHIAALHPSAIVDSLHLQCSSAVKAKNKLKKHESNSDSSDKKEGNEGKDNMAATDVAAQLDLEREDNTSKTTRLQVMVSLSQINICVLQSSLVEEVISFSGLDKVQDITCVSLLAVSLDNITCQLLTNSHSQKSIEVASDPSPTDSTSRKFPTTDNIGKKKLESPNVELETDSMAEMQREEMVGNLHIGRIHFQLRRMKKNSNFSDHIILTAIPEYRSKALFTFQKQLQFCNRETTHGAPMQGPFHSQDDVEDIAGFIMFECGLENIDLKAAKRSGFYGNCTLEDEDVMAHISHILANAQRKTNFDQKMDESEYKESEPGSVPQSQMSGNSADDEASSWHSRVSNVSDSSDEEDELTGPKKLEGDASSCVLEFKTAWFNFAAPPPTPKKRKLNFTRLDWNLLSAATPAINAWMNPSHRLMMVIKIMLGQIQQRVSTVMACIMTEALETPGIHMPYKSKFNKITSLSKTLQEDPSCQLLTVLRRYIDKVGIKVIDDNINVDTVPQLLTIQKGLLALTRQWKNILYMPILADSINFKSRKKVQPYTVTFAIPHEESMDFNMMEDVEIMGSLDNFEVIDEKTSLLKAEGGSVQRSSSLGNFATPEQPAEISRPASAINLRNDVSPETKDSRDHISATSAMSVNKQGEKKASTGVPILMRLLCGCCTTGTGTSLSRGKMRASIPAMTTPFSSVDSPGRFTSVSQRSQSLAFNTPANIFPGKMKRNESNMSFASGTASISSTEHIATASVAGTPVKQSLMRQLSELEKREDEDLYRWMQRQQEYTKLCDQPNLHYYPSIGQDSLMNAGVSEYSQDDSVSMQRYAMAHSAMQLADAQVLFKPLLGAIGLHLEAVKTSAAMKKFGGNISVKGVLQTLRIDIVDSENDQSRKSKGKGKGAKTKKIPRFLIDTGFEMSAFNCDSFAVMISMKDIIDFEKDKLEQGSAQDVRRKSLKAIKFAMENMEAKPTTTKVHFSVNCQSVSQHVNMSLLRLVHQFVTMIENVNETRVELKHNEADYRTHRKQNSKGSSSGTETQSIVGGDTTKAGLSPTADIDVVTPPPPQTTNQQVPEPEPAPEPEQPPPPPAPAPVPPQDPVKSHTAAEQNRPDKLAVGLMLKSPKRFSLKKMKGDQAPAAEVQSPLHSLNLSDSVAIEIADTSSPALAEKTIVDEIKENTPKCWRTLYHLLDLYSTMPETKTLGRKVSRLSVIDEEPEKTSQTHSVTKNDMAGGLYHSNMEAAERQPTSRSPGNTPLIQRTYTGNTFTQSILIGERIPLVVFGIAKVKRIRISAMLSGLKLEADMQNVYASATHRERVKGVLKRKSSETSATAHTGHTMIVLLEGVLPNMQTVVTVNISRSQGLYSSVKKKSKEHNASLVTVGKIDVDIPQHPVVLHGMVARSSKRLSSTLQEFRRPPSKVRSHDSIDMPSTQPSKHSELSDYMYMNVNLHPGRAQKPETPAPPLVIHFKAVLKGLTIGASLLPSLKAQYKMGEVTGSGLTGKKARFHINLPSHTLSFNSKVYGYQPDTPTPYLTSTPHPLSGFRRHSAPSAVSFFPPEIFSPDVAEKVMFFGRPRHHSTPSGVNTPSNLPSSASVDLPPIHIHADYRQHNVDSLSSDEITEGLVLREGNYLNAVAEVGSFEHSLTTDLLNHLVFVQKVFMKEVNEVVQKVSGGDQPVPLWQEDGMHMVGSKDTSKPLLYSLHFRLKGIQITATTPTSNAVRLETGSVELELSNRVQTASRGGDVNKSNSLKLFIKAQVDLNLALGQLLKNPMFEEAEPEFQILASFKTRIGLRNALQDEMITGFSKDQEALLITLKRPVIFVQPVAFDKAVLVWLNYKNAYEYWNEQRMALNKEVQTATQQVMDKLPLGTLAQQTAPALGTLFLQLTVEDLGICLPMDSFNQGYTSAGKMDSESGAAMVLTLESTLISACSFGSLVSKGRFNGFCLRFADDFEVSWDDWKPDKELDLVMNAMVVPEGTYEVCSRTINANATDPNSNAKWILNIMWQMQGIDIHLDHNIGKKLSTLGTTLTSLAGEELLDTNDIDSSVPVFDDREAAVFKTDAGSRKVSALPDGLPDFVYDPRLDNRTRARLIEKEMNEQAKVVQDLRQLGASVATIEIEARKLQELEAAVFHDFRQDIMKRLKRQSVRATALKDKLGLGYKPAHVRSKSVAAPPSHLVKPRRQTTIDSPRLMSNVEEGPVRPPPLGNQGRAFSVDVPPGEAVPGLPTVTFDTSPESPRDILQTTIDDPSKFTFDDISPPMSEKPYKRLSLQDIMASSSDSDKEEDQEVSYLMRNQDRPTLDSTRPASPTPRATSPSVGSGGSQKDGTWLNEPSVDFELDIKVVVDSGKCVLHPKEHKSESELDPRGKQVKKDSKDTSPNLPRKHGSKGLKKQDSASNLPKYRQNISTQQSNIEHTTVFFLPGVDVKVHYNSKTSPGGTESPGSNSKQDVDAIDGQESSNTSLLAAKKSGVKKANLYAWLSLQTLPEEMLISPALLDFLEQALDPIPLSQLTMGKKANAVLGTMELDSSATSLVSTGNYVYASFPVDVVVYIRVQPSVIRFTCLPISRVECLLRVPSLDLVFSTKRGDIDSNMLSDNTPPMKMKGGKRLNLPTTPREHQSSGSRTRTSSMSRTRASSGPTEVTAGGGLSVTGCLSDFSLFIFHPYGGGGQRRAPLGLFDTTFRSTNLGGISEGASPLGDTSTRKDSLSLNVEFIKVNISRSRKGIVQGDVPLSSSQSSSKLAPAMDSQTKAANVVRFSAVCDIGSASFKYDMRRLSEILALPRAWYRRSLARRMFLGEETMANVFDDSDEDISISSLRRMSSPSTPDSPLFAPASRAQTFASINMSHVDGGDKPTQHRRAASADKNVPLSPEFKRELDGLNHIKTPPHTPTREVTSAPHTPSEGRHKMTANKTFSPRTSPTRKNASTPASSKYKDMNGVNGVKRSTSGFPVTPTPSKSSSGQGWETLVLFAVNLSRLDVQVNMSNTMGNTQWATEELSSQGRLSIDSSGYRNMKITAGLGGSKMEARGGIVGGLLEIQQIDTFVSISEDPGQDPDHRAGLQLCAMELRLDYMGSSIMMGRISDMNITLADEWRVDKSQQLDSQPLATKRPALIFVHGDLGWDKFHLMISRSTTPDIIKMVAKLDEFFTQQFNSSYRVLSAFGPMPGGTKTKLPNKRISEDAFMHEVRHHRHWQKVVERVAGCKLPMLTISLPEHGAILGGTMAIHGNNLTLACFHGINFRSKAWALFTMDEPHISFATEAQTITGEDGVQSTHIVQNLSFQLGHNVTELTKEKHMCTICKLSRGHYMPPPFTCVQEWFHYAYASSELAGLDTFPQMHRQGQDSGERKSRKSQDYTHDTEIIFALPSLQMHLKTEHLQGCDDLLNDDIRPSVECSFVTEFEDHIFVAMDAEAVLFLHDLVINYLKEKDRGDRSSMYGKVNRSPETEKKTMTDPTTVLKQDLRDFNCKTWHLEPTVRLLSWAGKRIDPVGVDYILQKLGFQHARQTIPKWMQRGAMDPLDKILSVLVNKLIRSLEETPNEDSEDEVC